jgi:hypothetical protein
MNASINTILYDKYKFEIEIKPDQIYINLTDCEFLDIHEATINESDIFVKPIKKFYSMIDKSLNKEPNYTVTISENKEQLTCIFSYSTEMISIEEPVRFTKINTQKTKELLLVERIKELTYLATPVFGYRNFGEMMIFDIDSKVLDFRPFDDFKRYPNFQDYNKLTKVKKIIMSTKSSVCCSVCNISPYVQDVIYTCGCLAFTHVVATIAATAYGVTAATATAAVNLPKCPNHSGVLNLTFNTKLHFNHPSVYMPSVTEVEIYCSPYTELEQVFTKFGSLPNLMKLSLIHQSNEGFSTPFLDIHSMISTLVNKKLKHIVLKNISTWIKPDTVDKAKLFAQVNHIRFEII